MIYRAIPLTDDRGKPLLDPDQMAEPLPGSVVLTKGVWGNAWQRYFSDGMWHRGAETLEWEQLLLLDSVTLVYDAPVRPEKCTELWCTEKRRHTHPVVQRPGEY